MAKQTSRTKAACGFRWNATLSKIHANECAEIKAKKEVKHKQLVHSYKNDLIQHLQEEVEFLKDIIRNLTSSKERDVECETR